MHWICVCVYVWTQLLWNKNAPFQSSFLFFQNIPSLFHNSHSSKFPQVDKLLHIFQKTIYLVTQYPLKAFTADRNNTAYVMNTTFWGNMDFPWQSPVQIMTMSNP